jgi:hypothetical protein
MRVRSRGLARKRTGIRGEKSGDRMKAGEAYVVFEDMLFLRARSERAKCSTPRKLAVILTGRIGKIQPFFPPCHLSPPGACLTGGGLAERWLGDGTRGRRLRARRQDAEYARG